MGSGILLKDAPQVDFKHGGLEATEVDYTALILCSLTSLPLSLSVASLLSFLRGGCGGRDEWGGHLLHSSVQHAGVLHADRGGPGGLWPLEREPTQEVLLRGRDHKGPTPLFIPPIVP